MNEWCDPHYGEKKMWKCRVCGHNVFEYHNQSGHHYCYNCTTVFLVPDAFKLPTIKFKKLNSKAKLPTRATDGSVGWDLYAIGNHLISNTKTILIPTGLAVELPPNVEMQIRPRSGLSKAGLIVNNSPGTVDTDYRGEIKVMMSCIYDTPQTISDGARIAQALFTIKLPYILEEVDELSETTRGAGGWGSTGK